MPSPHLKELISAYSELENPSTFTPALEVNKLAIQSAVLNTLNPSPSLLKPPSPLKIFFKKLLYWLLFPIGTVISILQGIDGVVSLCELMGVTVTITAWPVVICCMIGAFAACALYYAFELEFLKEKLNLTHNKHLENTLSIYEQQIDTVNQIENYLVIAADQINLTEFNDYLTLLQKFKAQIIQINQTVQHYQENSLRKIMRYLAMKIGITLAIGDTLYTVAGLLGSTILTSNPYSLIVIIPLAIGSAAFFIVSYMDNVYEKMNSAAKQMNTTKDKAAYYCEHNKITILQEKLTLKLNRKRSHETYFVLQTQLKSSKKQLARQKETCRQQQQELVLWQLWRSKKQIHLEDEKKPRQMTGFPQTQRKMQ
jgi:hypothetical protein